MAPSTSFSTPLTIFLFSLLMPLLFGYVHATTLDIQNNCNYTIWAASTLGGGQRLDHGQNWTLDVPADITSSRIWGRTGCNFSQSGMGKCLTGDCKGLLECQAGAFGSPPNTLVEFAPNKSDVDYFDISLVDGFNLPVQFSSTSKQCVNSIKCTGDIIGQCPAELRAPGGCNNPCTVFNTSEYCCYSGPCPPTKYSTFFKNMCPDALANPDQASTYRCPTGNNYKVVFCP